MLESFTIFSIRDEFAKRYFYKSDILFRFLKKAISSEDKILSKQFNYITQSFSTSMILSQLTHIDDKQVTVNEEDEEIMIQDDRATIQISINDKFLTFACDQTYQSEELLYHTLRDVSPYMFIMNDKKDNNYGWVSPLNQKLRYKSGQLLYSFL